MFIKINTVENYFPTCKYCYTFVNATNITDPCVNGGIYIYNSARVYIYIYIYIWYY